MQTRIGRKTVTKNLLAKTPVVFMAYDLMEFNGKDIREEPFGKRRERLEGIFREMQETPEINHRCGNKKIWEAKTMDDLMGWCKSPQMATDFHRFYLHLR